MEVCQRASFLHNNLHYLNVRLNSQGKFGIFSNETGFTASLQLWIFEYLPDTLIPLVPGAGI